MIEEEIKKASIFVGGKEVDLGQYLLDNYRNKDGERPISVKLSFVKGSKDESSKNKGDNA